MGNTKFTYRSSPIFKENDKETIKAWESRKFDTMLIFCKLYRNEEGKYGVGYSILFEDGWEYGLFHEHLGKVKDIKEASLKGLFELLLHAQEESAKRLVIWSENNKFLEQMIEADIRKKKPLRELYDSFEQVRFTNIGDIEIENLGDLRDSVFRSAKSGSEYRTRRKRFKVLLQVSEKGEPKEAMERRQRELAELMAEGIHKYMTRPADEKIRDAENELKEIENNIEEQPDYEDKRAKLLDELEIYKREKQECDKQESELAAKQAKVEAKKKLETEQMNKILIEQNLCVKCRKKIKKEWKFCPFCSVTINTPT